LKLGTRHTWCKIKEYHIHENGGNILALKTIMGKVIVDKSEEQQEIPLCILDDKHKQISKLDSTITTM